MAVYTGGMRQREEKKKEALRLAKATREQQKKAQKRSGWSGLVGKIAGMGLGALGVGALGLTGGLAAPLMMAAGQFAGRKAGYELTRGMAADPSKIKAESKYGYGKEEAKTLREELESQMVVDPLKERGGFGKDLLSSYLSAGLSGGLTGGTKALLSGDKGSIAKALTGKTDWASQMKAGDIGGWKGAKEGLFGLLPEGEEYIERGEDPTMDYESLAGADMTGPEYDKLVTSRQAAYTEPEDFWDVASPEPIGQSYEVSDTPIPFVQDQGEFQWPSGFALAQGGLVPNKAPSIVDYFSMQGKTLGGSNTQSLSQMLGIN